MRTRSDIHPVDPVLTNVSLKFKNSGFVASRIFPVVPVAEVSGTYFVYGKQNFDLPSLKRTSGSGYNRSSFEITNDTYAAFRYGLEDVIDDDDRLAVTSPLNLDMDATNYVTDKVLLGYEKRVVDIVTDNSVITQTTALTTTSQWNDYVNSDPIGDIDTGKNTISAATGLPESELILVLGKEVFDQLKRHPQLIELIKYTQRGTVSAELMAGIFGVKEVLVASSLYNSAKAGQTASLTRLWGKNALLAWPGKGLSLRSLSLGYTMQKEAFQTRKYRHEKEIGDVIRVSHYTDEKLVSALCGYLITTAVA